MKSSLSTSSSFIAIITLLLSVIIFDNSDARDHDTKKQTSHHLYCDIYIPHLGHQRFEVNFSFSVLVLILGYFRIGIWWSNSGTNDVNDASGEYSLLAEAQIRQENLISSLKIEVR